MSVDTTPAVLEVRNPADGSLVNSVPIMDARAVNEAAAELRMAQVGWQALGPDGRATWLRRWRDWILAHADELTDLLQAETGKARPDALIEPVASCEFISYYADNAAAFLADEKVKPAGPMTLPKRLTKVYSPVPGRRHHHALELPDHAVPDGRRARRSPPAARCCRSRRRRRRWRAPG